MIEHNRGAYVKPLMGTKRNPEWPESPDEEERGREMKPEKSATVRYLDSIPRTMESDGESL